MTSDVRYGFRMIRKRPVFAAVAVLALGLGIGANSAVFSVTNGVLLRPVPLPDLDRLVAVRNVDPRRPKVAKSFAVADYLDLRERSRSFERLTLYTFHDFDLSSPGNDPEGYVGALVRWDFFSTLRAKPELGRDFREGEDEPGHTQVVILSHTLWRTRFASDPAVVGRTIHLDAKPFEVIGVMPAGFEFPAARVALWSPLPMTPALRADRTQRGTFVIGRLKDDVRFEEARGEAGAVAQQLQREYPTTNADRGFSTVLLRENQLEFSGPFLTLMHATAIFVLLIACANVANLQLAQGVARRREIAIRSALGAGRSRVVRLLMIESVIVAAAGGLVGVAVAYWGVSALKAAVPPHATYFVTGWNQIGLDTRVLLFTLGVAVGTGLLFGWFTALHSSRLRVADSLKEGNQQGGTRSRLRTALVVAEVLLAVVAVTGATQMVAGFRSMFEVYQGFSPDRILTMRVSLPQDRHPDPARFFDRVLAELSNLPRVQSATVSTNLPGALVFNRTSSVEIEGKAARTRAETPISDVQIAGPGYFQTLSIPIRAGRAIEHRDGPEAPRVVVVSARFASQYLPGEDAIGKRIRFGGTDWWTIIGVAGDVNQFWFQKEFGPLMYVPYRQAPVGMMKVALRTNGDPLSIVPAVRERMRGLDPNLPLHDVKDMRDLTMETMGAMQLTTNMMSTFGVIALLLAAVGVYGVMSYSVAQRRREFGIRMALGARPGMVLRLVLKQGLGVTLWGIVLGVAGAVALTQAMSAIMYGVSGTKLTVLAGVPAALIVVSAVSCWFPARAATTADPVMVLRQE